MAKKKKSKSVRDRTKYPGLTKKANRWNIQHYMDFDYLDKLSDKEKEFLSQFATEHYSADFRGDATLIKGKKKRREIYNNNNARNRDLYSLAQGYGGIESFIKYNPETKSPENIKVEKVETLNPEDALNELIDIKGSLKVKCKRNKSR